MSKLLLVTAENCQLNSRRVVGRMEFCVDLHDFGITGSHRIEDIDKKIASVMALNGKIDRIPGLTEFIRVPHDIDKS